MSSSRYTKIVKAIQNFRVIDLPRIERRIAEQEDAAQVLKSYFHNIDRIHFDELKETIVVAVDGGMTTSNYEGVHLAMATAHTFSAEFSESSQLSEENEAKILRIPPTEPNLVFSIYMKALEFTVANRALNRIDKESEVIILFDGAFTYPEEDPSMKPSTQLGKASKEYKEQASSFFNDLLIRREEGAISMTAAISKDAIAGKFLKGLEKTISKGILNPPKEGIDAIQSLMSEEAFAERFYLNVAMVDQSMVRTDFVKVSDQIRKGMRIPIESLEKSGIYGSYFKPFKYSRPFYTEIPKWDLPLQEKLSKIICKLSWLSPKQGYPYPLVYADRLAKVKQDMASDIFRVIEHETHSRLGKKANLVFDRKFRRKVGI